MPRDGSQIYHRPPGTDGIPDTSIESTKYNAYVADIEQDLNLPRPIIAGGTGANNAHDAMIALNGEIANQQVTNYDDFPFVSGSFWSVPGVTSAPNSINYFSGTAVSSGASDIILEARTLGGGALGGTIYLREKNNGVWLNSGAWTVMASPNDLQNTKVNRAGDTMTGALNVISGDGHATFIGGAAISLNKPTAANYNIIAGQTAGINNWRIDLGTAGTSDFVLHRWDDAGTYLGPGLAINRLTAASSMYGTLSVTGDVNASQDLTTSRGVLRFTSDPTNHYLFWTGGEYNLVPGILNVGGNGVGEVRAGLVTLAGGVGNILTDGTNILNRSNGGYYWQTAAAASRMALDVSGNLTTVGQITAPVFQSSTRMTALAPSGGLALCIGETSTGYNKYLRCDTAANLQFVNNANTAILAVLADNGNFNCIGTLSCAGTLSCGAISSSIGRYGRQGYSGGASGSVHNWFWNGTYIEAWVDTTNFGGVSLVSDYRIKKDIVDLPDMWETVKALRPIKYTQAQFSPPSHVKHVAEQALKARKEAEENPDAKPGEVNTGPLFAEDDIERWGFVAHELQETLTPSAATGVKDSPDTIQSPNPFTLIAALTKALQEAMARIEALEGAAQPARR